MGLSVMLARRFFSSGAENGKRASRPAIVIATAGIAVGLAVMIVSVCVVRGFQAEVSNKLMGFGSHMEVLDINSFASPESFPVTTDAALVHALEALPEVTKVQRYAEKIGILKTEESFAAIELKGLGPEYDTAFLRKHLVEGKLPQFSDTVSSNELVISKRISDDLQLHVNDRVYAYFFEETVKMRRFRIAAIYQTNMKQFDRTFAITDLHTVRRLNSWDASQSSALEIRVSDFSHLDEMKEKVEDVVDAMPDTTGTLRSVLTIRENPRTAGVFNWLALLDTNVYVILVLILLVASFSMISGLLILILERTQTIGVLKALGATNTRLRHTFLYYGALIILRGMLIGNVLSLQLLWAQRQFSLIHLNPETYYVDTVPVSLEWWPIVLVNVVTLLLTVLALVVPSFLVSRIQPARAIRFD
ncbi:MAG: ABC transporter permease [Alloprevotella sp.]|nr:ABC transporter permease [Alloprevotella sp.]